MQGHQNLGLDAIQIYNKYLKKLHFILFYVYLIDVLCVLYAFFPTFQFLQAL